MMKTWMLPGPRQGKGTLPCARYLLAPLNGNEGSSKSHMALRDKPTQAWSPTNNLYTPMYNTLVFYTKCVMPVGHLLLCAIAKL